MGHWRPRAIVVAALGALALWNTAAAQTVTPTSTDELGNQDDVGTGAVYRPDTPEDLMLSGDPVQISGIDPVAFPPGSDAETQAGPGEQMVRGPILHADGNLVQIWLQDSPVVVELPPGVSSLGAFGPDSLLQATGAPSASGIFQARQVLLWPTPAE